MSPSHSSSGKKIDLIMGRLWLVIQPGTFLTRVGSGGRLELNSNRFSIYTLYPEKSHDLLYSDKNRNLCQWIIHNSLYAGENVQYTRVDRNISKMSQNMNSYFFSLILNCCQIFKHILYKFTPLLSI